MNSISLAMARKVAEEYSFNLKATDSRFNRSVSIILQDEPTVLFYDGAFSLKYNDYYFIFSEHHPTQVYHENEAFVSQRGERLAIEDL